MTAIDQQSVSAISKYINRLQERKLEMQELKREAIDRHNAHIQQLKREIIDATEAHRDSIESYNVRIAEFNRSLAVMVPAKDKLLEGD